MADEGPHEGGGAIETAADAGPHEGDEEETLAEESEERAHTPSIMTHVIV